MPAYAVCHLSQMSVNRELVVYLKKIDATLDPFNGRFLVHGNPEVNVVEGHFPGNLIIIEFPNFKQARSWYYSEAYQEIVSMRMNNSEGSVILVDGVAEGYRASDMLGNR